MYTKFGTSLRNLRVTLNYDRTKRENHTYVAPNTQENTMFSIVSVLRDIQENQLKLQQEFLRYKNQKFFQPHGRVPITGMSNPGYGQVSP